MKKKTKTKAKRKPKQKTHVYTLRDGSGMHWRMDGLRPVSALADLVMRQAGF